MDWSRSRVTTWFGSGIVALTLAGCSGQLREPVQVAETVPPRMQESSAEELDIVVDAPGRPYDVLAWADWQATTLGSRELGLLVIPGGHLRVMDGNAIEVDPKFFADEATGVEFGSDELLRLSIVTLRSEFEGEVFESIAGVRLDVDRGASAEAKVERWQAFEYAYGTDGGVGGVTTQSVLDDPKGIGRELIDWGTDDKFFIGDHDGVEGADTFVFSNGVGDGGFPMTRGLDSEGELVSLMIWHQSYPWRLAVSDGTPPIDVTNQEDALSECMAGTRPIDQWNNCLTE